MGNHSSRTFVKLIDAVIWAESSGNAKAEGPDVSPAPGKQCAKGLMQLMDATGREWHARLKISAPYDPFNAEQNRKIGTAYLVHLIAEFGSVETALAAYNWGPGHVHRTCQGRQSRTWGAIRARCPAETQQYVGKIMCAWEGKEIA